MSEGAAGHYALNVLRARDVTWYPKLFYSKIPDLYVEVECGQINKKTRTVKKNSSPTWNEPLTFALLEPSTILHVRLRHKSCWLSDPCIGYLDISVVDLLDKCANGEVQLPLEPPPKKRRKSISPAGTIHLHLEASSALDIASIEVKAAKQDASRLELSQQIGTAKATVVTAIDDVDQISRNDLLKYLESLLSKLDAFVKCVDVLSEIHPYVSLAWNVASALYKSVSNQIKVDEKLLDLVRIMVDAFAFLQDTQSLPDKMKNLEKPINELLKQTTECCYFVRQYTRPGFFGRMLDLNSSQKIDEFRESFISLKDALHSGIGLHAAFVSARISDNVDAIYLQNRLNPVEPDASDRPQCLQGTRLDVRSDIVEAMSSESGQNVLWLYGVAGCGKSTVSTTIAEYFRSISRLGAFLFFERGKSEPNTVIRTLAFKLASFDSSIAKLVVAAFKKDSDIAKAPTTTQFERLIAEPLTAAASAMQGPVVIILDALDECGTPESRKDLMRLFSQRLPKLPSNFRFLLTSRSETDFVKLFSARSDTVLAIELDIKSEGSRVDVQSYIHHEMNKIFRSPDSDATLPTGWPWDTKMLILVKTAAGLFIWASTVVKLVANSSDPFYTLEELIAQSQHPSGSVLDTLYATVLHNSGIFNGDDRSRVRFVNIIGLVLLSKVPLSIDTIDGILGLRPESSSRLILLRLSSVINYSLDGNVHLFHTSFSDYLVSPKRSSDPWVIDVPSQHSFIASRCFGVMESGLRFNICSIETSFIRNDEVSDIDARIKDQIPMHLDYACVYWVQHLCEVSHCSTLSVQLSTFAFQRLLFWFEVLSLLSVFNRTATQALLHAASWTVSDTDLYSFLKDASELSNAFSRPITESVPHIYISMLPLMCQDSVVAKHYSKQMVSPIEAHRIGTKLPPQWLKVFEGHTDSVRSANFSPDGKYIASGSNDCTIRIWDTMTGALVAGPFEGRGAYVLSVNFSPNGRFVVSASGQTVEVWDLQSGEVTPSTLKGHTNYVWSASFSPDSKYIVSSSEDRTIIVWDVVTKMIAFGPFKDHTDAVLSVAFSSPDGRRIVSGSADRTVRVWELESQKCILGPFEGHSGDVNSVAFSPDGKIVVSGSDDSTIIVWNLDKPEAGSRIIKGHTNIVFSVAFSQDGTRIVSGSADRTVRIWNVMDGKPISRPLEGHTNQVTSVAFSPDDMHILSGSADRSVRLWGANLVETISGSFEGSNANLHSISVSPDGSHIVSGGSDNVVRVWDINGNPISGPFVRHMSSVTVATFSPDGTRIVSGSKDKTIIIWDAASGECILKPLGKHTEEVRSIAISSDGTRVVSGSFDKTIIVWDMVSGELLAGPFEGHKDRVRTVAISSNGSRIVSGSDDKAIIVWGAETGRIILGPLTDHTGEVFSVLFTFDGERIVSCSWDRSIIVWDADNGDVLFKIFGGDNSNFYSAALSADGAYIVSGSDDEMVRIWDTRNGELIFGPFGGHAGGTMSVAFSPNGRQVIAGSWDYTIRVWNIGRCSSPKLIEETEGGAASTISMPSESLSDWTMTDNGWLQNQHGERLLWIPPDIRPSLWYPQNTAVFGCSFSTKLDFKGATLGESWQECFIPLQ